MAQALAAMALLLGAAQAAAGPPAASTPAAVRDAAEGADMSGITGIAGMTSGTHGANGVNGVNGVDGVESVDGGRAPAPLPVEAPAPAPVPAPAPAPASRAVIVPAAPSDFGDKPLAPVALGARRGGTETVSNDMQLNGAVGGNTAVNVYTGANSISEGAFSNASGLPVAIQNSGANVLIQNATIINIQMR